MESNGYEESTLKISKYEDIKQENLGHERETKYRYNKL